MATMTIEAFNEMRRHVEKMQGPSVSTGLLYPFGGLPIFDSLLMTETETYSVTVELTFRQRWIEPISTFRNFQMMPFEPWVKTRKETRTRQVPMRHMIQAGNALIMHPALRSQVSAIISNVVA